MDGDGGLNSSPVIAVDCADRPSGIFKFRALRASRGAVWVFECAILKFSRKRRRKRRDAEMRTQMRDNAVACVCLPW
jgi:hypothetical protein